jgi:hypothetical protein
MEAKVTNVAVDSGTPDMKEHSRGLVRTLAIGVGIGLVSGFLIAIWIAGSDWLGTMIATSLCVMGAGATIGGLIAANFTPE